jgi:hypothetical protein
MWHRVARLRWRPYCSRLIFSVLKNSCRRLPFTNSTSCACSGGKFAGSALVAAAVEGGDKLLEAEEGESDAGAEPEGDPPGEVAVAAEELEEGDEDERTGGALGSLSGAGMPPLEPFLSFFTSCNQQIRKRQTRLKMRDIRRP